MALPDFLASFHRYLTLRMAQSFPYHRIRPMIASTAHADDGQDRARAHAEARGSDEGDSGHASVEVDHVDGVAAHVVVAVAAAPGDRVDLEKVPLLSVKSRLPSFNCSTFRPFAFSGSVFGALSPSQGTATTRTCCRWG